MTELEYEARDRSILLPLYKRWLVEPLVARLPARLSPNAITHAGHLINLAALSCLLLTGAERGAWLVVSGLLVQLYVVCDNADGTHARRTGQCSTYGELLDHGLDTLNVAYIACMSAYALGLPTMWSALLVALVTGASALTFFEQTQTGTFVLGRLNQQEAGFVLTAVLFISAGWGRDVWASTTVVPGVSAQILVLALVGLSLLFAMLRATGRVLRQRDLRAILPALVLLMWNALVFVVAAAGVVSPRVALALALTSNTFFAGRMLARRMCHGAHPRRLAGPPPPVERTLIAATAALAACVLASFACLGSLSPHVDTAAGVVAASLFSIAMIRDARRGISIARLPAA